MGRHSAPESDLDEAAESAALELAPDLATAHKVDLVDFVGRRGRHARPADLAPDEVLEGQVIHVATVEVDGGEDRATATTGEAAGDAAASEAGPGRPPSGTRGDLQLLRSSRSLRLRCAAAVVLPFAIYTAVFVLLGRTDVYLIWVWIPTVLAGVLIGAFLDAAHRRLNAPPPVRP